MTRSQFKQAVYDASKEDNHSGKDRIHLLALLPHIEKLFDEHEVQLKNKDEEIEVLHSHLKTIDEDYSALANDFESAVMEIERLKSYVEKLWQIVDDIDTYGDMAKSDDAFFRRLVEKKQKQRWELPITTDGYRLIFKDAK